MQSNMPLLGGLQQVIPEKYEILNSLRCDFQLAIWGIFGNFL